MTQPMIAELLKARQGLPTEDQAARIIAIYSAIPAAICGMAIGILFLEMNDPASTLVLYCAGGAFAAGFWSVMLIMSTYWFFGFRLVSRIANGMIGGFVGFAIGMFLTVILNIYWPLILCPLGAVVNLILAPVKKKTEAIKMDT